MSPEAYTAEAVQQAIAQGASGSLSGGSSAGHSGVKPAATTEVTSYLQYQQHAYTAVSQPASSQRRL